MDRHLKLIESSFKDKEFVAKLLHDSIPEYKDIDIEYIANNYVLDEEVGIECVIDRSSKLNKIVVNFEAIAPDGNGYIGFTVNFVI